MNRPVTLSHLLTLSLILLFGWAVMLATARVTPIFEAPDEGAHFLYADTLAATGAFPVIEGREAVLSSRSHQRHQPPLYYLIGAALIADTDRSRLADSLQGNPFAVQGQVAHNNATTFIHRLIPPDETAIAVWRYRLFGMALALVTACGVYQAARRITRRRDLAALSMLALLCIPSFLFIASAINNDNLAALLGTFGFLWLIRAWDRGRISPADAVLFGAITGGALLTKLNIALIAPLAFGWLAIGVLRRRVPARDWLRAALLSGGVTIALAGWWYWRNLDLYGDLLAVRATSAVWGRGAPPTDLGAIGFEAEGVWRSFWMVLGNFNTPGPDWLIGLASAACLVMLGGLLLRAARGRVRPVEWMALTWGGAMIAALIAVTRTINASQGRFLFPILVALLPLLIAELHRVWRGAPLLLIGGLAVGALLMPSATLPRAFPLATAVPGLPAEAIAVDAQADGVALLGYALRTAVVSPRGIIEVDVYLSGTGRADLVLLAKVIDPVSSVPIASVDTPPGLISADQFVPGVVYRVRLRLVIEEARITGLEDRRLEMAFGWWRGLDGAPYSPDRLVPFTSSGGARFDLLRVESAWLDQ